VTFGCSPPPPSEDAILYYIRNARVRGPVRRAWLAGQKYLDAIMKHDAALQQELRPLTAVTTPESLWPKSDPRWQDRGALETQVKDLENLLALTGGGKEARDRELRDLQQAVEAVPAGLTFDTPERKAAFGGNVWDALAVRHVPLTEYVADLEAAVQARLDLYRTVLFAATDFDAGRQAILDQQYDAFAQRLRAARETYLARADQDMVADAKALATINKRQQRLQYEALTNESKYLRDELEALAKRLSTQAEQAANELKKLQAQLKQANTEQKTKLETELAFRRQRAEELDAEAKAVRKRFEEIRQRAEAAKGPGDSAAR
jgi:DNA repair exonuclease SbcCD ATPase subunit